MSDNDLLRRAADAIAGANALLIGAGAGMGVDSGLPDFRGDQGFWKAYPPYAKLGLRFVDMANPRWFETDPEMAWGFYGHRLNLYRAARPHAGFQILRDWAARMARGAFVYTSNVDGHFQKAGFDADSVLEVHGAIDWMQCTRRACAVGLFPVGPGETPLVRVDETTMRAVPPLPACPSCGALSRPNILMFGDGDWDEGRAFAQEERFRAWLRRAAGPRLVVVECGAGTAVPTVRRLCEWEAAQHGGTLIRINPREPQVPAGHIGLATGALAGLKSIAERFVS